MKQLTAVEWLIEQYVNKGYIGIQDELQAKEMEKQQITDATRIARQDDFWEKYNLYEDYYNDIYGPK
jgi:hypothetical protein